MITLVLGGARSGKSAIAEYLVARHPAPITYLATLRSDIDDDDLAARIRSHQQSRPAEWATAEVGPPPQANLAQTLRSLGGTVLLDALGPYVAAHQDFAVDVDHVCAALQERDGDTVIVSDEVGMGVHPATTAGRAFRDAVGSVNQAVAAVSDQVLLAVAGRVLPLHAVDDLPALGELMGAASPARALDPTQESP